jgi:hypothetical protein
MSPQLPFELHLKNQGSESDLMRFLLTHHPCPMGPMNLLEKVLASERDQKHGFGTRLIIMIFIPV